MTHVVTLEAIQETINDLGLANQINVSVFLIELEQQMMRPGDPMLPPPLADLNNMPKGEVRRVTASPEDIARRRRLRQLLRESFKDSLGNSPYPSTYERTSVRKVQLSADEVAHHRNIIKDTKKAPKGRFPTPYIIPSPLSTDSDSGLWTR
ncbi:hypothetical protein Clacol_008967 [Clathrus columnatus]|uniref:Uncharacterized protein n=1 Tax=Clathrus columnatus TaxID=1419009 RepID=A0AAV5AJY3_9AGAM|nr:hypothetical protein Clacol_008967 [Clathrus columnatus]